MLRNIFTVAQARDTLMTSNLAASLNGVAVGDAVLLKTENYVLSVQFWSQGVPLILTKKYPHLMFLTTNNDVIGSLKLPNLTTYPPWSRASISASRS